MKLLMLLPGQVIEVCPYAGSEINACKQEASALAELLQCNVKLTHNLSTFMFDREGNSIIVS